MPDPKMVVMAYAATVAAQRNQVSVIEFKDGPSESGPALARGRQTRPKVLQADANSMLVDSSQLPANAYRYIPQVRR